MDKIDCTTCKYGYEDERLGIPMCHHPKRFSENCVDFNMHEEKHLDGKSDKSLEEAAKEYEWSNVDTNQLNPPTLDMTVQVGDLRNAFIAGAEWQASQMPMPEDTVLFNNGVAEGRRLEREDMLKGAVEGTVNQDGILELSNGEAIDVCPSLDKCALGLQLGKKVKLITVKDHDTE